jgi:acid phosphatase type 7
MAAQMKSRSFITRTLRYFMIIVLVTASIGYADGWFTGNPNPAAAAGDPVIAAAGDIACDPLDSNFNNGNGISTECRQKATSDLMVNAGLAGVLALGDDQYYCGSLQAFNSAYDPSWGRLKSITHPSVGNHEYLTAGGSSPATACDPTNSGAAGYFNYFGSAAGTKGQGYYSFDIGTWHLIALNSNCSDAGGCGTSSPQYKWLQADLAAHPNFCTLAFWHIPLYSSGGRASPNSQNFWNLLYANNADLILNGHDHIYERFAAQNQSAIADPVNGIREFIVGTGGNNHTTITTVAANSEVRNTNTFGILKLTLHATSYDWQFVPEPGKTFTDSGTTSCHGGTAATPTSTLIGTNTPTRTLTSTNTPLVSNTPTRTFTPSITPAVSNTPTFTLTSTNTSAFTNTPTFTSTATSSGGSFFTFLPLADAYVDSSNPTANFGTGNTLRVDGSPIVNAYLRFNVTGLSGSISNVSLKIFANTSGSQGVRALSVVDTTWGETTINSNNAPPMGSQFAASSAFTSLSWVTMNVTSYITGNGTFSIGITDPNATAISLAARESGANAPQLVVTVSGGGPTPTNTPVFTNTFTPTFAASNTATSTFTPTSTLAVTNTSTSTPTTTNTATSTSTPTPTLAVTNTFTSTPTITNTATSTSTPTPTLAITNTFTFTPTITDTAMNTSTPTATSVASNTPTFTPTNTIAVTNTPTFTPTNTTAVTNTPTFTPTATSSGGQSITFNPVADAYVDSSNPTANFGTGNTIRIDGSPVVNTYLRFNVSGVSGTITRVRLLLFANSSGGQGVRAASVADNSWGETTINANNAPALGSQVASSSAFASLTWVTLDVTAYVTGNGTFSIAITDPTGTAISLAARESGANAPQLIIDTQ